MWYTVKADENTMGLFEEIIFENSLIELMMSSDESIPMFKTFFSQNCQTKQIVSQSIVIYIF